MLLSLRVEHVERERASESESQREQHPSTVHDGEGAVTDEAGGGGRGGGKGGGEFIVHLREREATGVQVSAPERCSAVCSGRGGGCEGGRGEDRGGAWRDSECGDKEDMDSVMEAGLARATSTAVSLFNWLGIPGSQATLSQADEHKVYGVSSVCVASALTLEEGDVISL
jgi:hypothetical protein